jgi:UDP-N-acetylglucosamine 2-epimerase (non-hydrolysing)/GDP/UDP-N,N'-diacetylbacillosamine 2-epimerase (hydrolysing)
VLEAASIPIPAVNVGIRQTGRFAGKNVIWTGTDRGSILSSIKKARSTEFLSSIKGMKNPYGDGASSQRVYEIIKNTDFRPLVLKKEDILELNQ